MYLITGAGLPAKYQAVQAHLHWGSTGETGSEHTWNGRQFPAEVRIRFGWLYHLGAFQDGRGCKDGSIPRVEHSKSGAFQEWSISRVEHSKMGGAVKMGAFQEWSIPRAK